jgi:thiamine pyrophosphate-dependent acetolactate synthase large subunit-like protein
MPITHIVFNNDELAKISREQVGGLRPVWETSLVNPDFAAYAELCGGAGFRADRPEDVEEAVGAALAVRSGPFLVEVRVSPRWV